MRRLMIGLTLVCMAALIPLWVRADDRQIAQKIIQQMQKHKDSGQLKEFGIDFQVEEGVVLMEGRVRSPKQEKLALETVRRVNGVKRVVNKLTIVGRPALKVQTAERQEPVAKRAYNATLASLKGAWGGSAKQKTDQNVGQQAAAQPTTEKKAADKAALMAAKDEQITKAIGEGLNRQQAEGKLKGFRVALSVEQGTVWLQGDVASREQRILILEIARHVAGVSQVVNELKIREAKLPAVPAKTAQTAAKPDGEKVAQPIPVVATKPKAEIVAPQTALTNPQVAKIDTTPLAPAVTAPVEGLVADGKIAGIIAERLESHKKLGNLKDFTVNLSVNRGVVWLQGDVPSTSQRGLILEVARHVPGVERVVDEMEILPLLKTPLEKVSAAEQGTEKPEVDAQIAGLVAQRFEEHKKQGNLRDFTVNLNVNRGTVWLEGEVTTLGERALMFELARHVPGVTKVVNELEVKPAASTASLIAQAPIGTAADGQPNVLPASGEALAQLPMPMRYVSQLQPAYVPAHAASVPSPVARTRYDHPQMPAYAWPTYASHPNYAAVTYPKQYSPSAWPYIGPFHPYPQVPLGWRKVTLEWDDGWWQLDFKNRR